MSSIANTPSPPYYAVIFTSITSDSMEGYAEMAAEMQELAAKQPGFLGIESARNDIGITVSYWRDIESINAWRKNIEHKNAQIMGKQEWYADYNVRICKVDREYGKQS